MRAIGRQQRLTPAWLARRELAALGGDRKVALNNAAFVGPGGVRVTVMQKRAHPRIVALRRLPWARLRSTLARSRAVYFPTGLEAFGFRAPRPGSAATR